MDIHQAMSTHSYPTYLAQQWCTISLSPARSLLIGSKQVSLISPPTLHIALNNSASLFSAAKLSCRLLHSYRK